MRMTTSVPTSAVLLIGVSGGSGSGKTTFGRMLQANLGDHFCGILAQDSYYRDMHEYFDRDGGTVNYDHPDSIEFELMVEHLKALKSGHDILVPNYDFARHRRLFESTFFPCRPIVIVDGILLLTQSELRPLLDFAFFIDTQEDLRFQRRLGRDTRERGRTPEGVRDQFLNHVKPMHDLFVEPSRRFADRVISGEKSFGPVIDEIVYGLKNPKAGTMALV
ncbi:MAG: uridine kinase [Bdellovibrionales bacterium]|nr:uridine kinase [Bdellovibrionales bacterium]